MSPNEEWIQALEKRVDTLFKITNKLEYHKKLLMELTDSSNSPFNYHMLEADATKEQVTKVFDLMDKALQSIRDRNPMKYNKFGSLCESVAQSVGNSILPRQCRSASLQTSGEWNPNDLRIMTLALLFNPSTILLFICNIK